MVTWALSWLDLVILVIIQLIREPGMPAESRDDVTGAAAIVDIPGCQCIIRGHLGDQVLILRPRSHNSKDLGFHFMEVLN
jgi:hypothetical protein